MTVTPEHLLGTWRLVSWVLTDSTGKQTTPAGPDPEGLLTYTADGFMFATLAAKGREPFAGADPLGGTPDECQRAMATCHSYCGRYRLDGDTVVHAVEMALFPNMVGTEQRRFLRIDGDRIVLRTPPMTRKGSSGVAELVWRRA